jgi:murein DD-endopeptidase MepM/ murein hydrolase activator NlpD
MRAQLRTSPRSSALAGVVTVVACLLVELPSSSATAAAAGSGASAARGAVWSWPVAAPHPVVRPFVGPPHPWSPGHRGIDVEATPGAVVLAPDDGVVHFAGVVVDRPVLSIEHADGVLSSVEPVTAVVVTGDVVTRGQTVGVLDPGHCADQGCLHLGARVDGEYVSPLLFLGGVEPSVLLPTRPG